MLLFDQFQRDDSRPAGYSEPSFTHLNRRAGQAWDNVRGLLEEWYSRLPGESRPELRGRFRGREETGFRSAFFEMYCHEILLRSGWAVNVHPSMNDTTRRPDFSASRCGTNMVLEATMTSPPSKDAAAQRREDKLIDSINERIEIGDFTLSLDIEERGAATAPTSGLCARLQQWLGSLDADDLLAERDRDPDIEPLSQEWAHEGWRLTFTAWPLEREHRGPGGRIIGVGPIQGGVIDDVRPVVKRLRAKASAYGDLSGPFVIAVDAVSDFTGDDDVVSALYGSNAVQYYVNPGPNDPAPRQIRLPDGLWRGTQGWRHTQVSAVMSTTTLKPWTAAMQAPTLWHHPSADRPLGDVASLLRQARLYRHEGQIHWEEPPTPPWRFFGLSEGWPHFDQD